MTKIIGITGGIGTGKSTVSSVLRDRGYRIIDADRIARDVVRPGSTALEELAAAFGGSILNEEGGLDRGALASIVFSDDQKKERMERIITDRVVEQVRRLTEEAREDGSEGLVFLDAPTLFETGADRLTDAVWLVTAAEDVRTARVMKRDGSTWEQVRRRMDAQMPEAEKAARSSDIIDNSGTLSDLAEQIDQLIEKYS